MKPSNQKGTHFDTPMHAIVSLQRLMIHKENNGSLQQYNYMDELSETVQKILMGSAPQDRVPYSTKEALAQGGMLLGYLYALSKIGVSHALLYIQTCVHISQISGGVQILQNHLDSIYARIPEEVIDIYTEIQQGILRDKGMTYDKHLHSIIETEHISYKEAEKRLESIQRQVAQFRIFLEIFYANYIFKKGETITPSQKQEINSLFQNFGDVFSNNLSIPLGFLDHNMIIDPIIQEKILREARIVN